MKGEEQEKEQELSIEESIEVFIDIEPIEDSEDIEDIERRIDPGGGGEDGTARECKYREVVDSKYV